MKNKVIEIKEEVQIGDIILEKGDKIKILKENISVILDNNMVSLISDAIPIAMRHDGFSKRYSDAEIDFVLRAIGKPY